MNAMRSVYLSGDAKGSWNDSPGADRNAQLERVARLGRDWLERVPVADPQRGDLVRMGILVEDLIRAGDHSVAAMTTTRALLCTNCRRLNAAEGKCLGQALERCRLLNGVNS